MTREELKYKFLKDDLTPQERQEFDRLIESDKSFAEEVDFEKKLKSTFNKSENQRLKELLQGEEEQRPRYNTVKTDWRWLKIAASVVLLIAAGWLAFEEFGSTDYDNLYAENFEVYPNVIHSFQRGDSGDDSIEKKAFRAYENKDYDEAISGFKSLDNQNPEAYINFYLAQSFLALGKIKDAKLHLESSIIIEDEYQDESLWYLSLLNIRENDIANAQLHLGQLVKLGTYKKSAAKKLLEQLD